MNSTIKVAKITKIPILHYGIELETFSLPLLTPVQMSNNNNK